MIVGHSQNEQRLQDGFIPLCPIALEPLKEIDCVVLADGRAMIGSKDYWLSIRKYIDAIEVKAQAAVHKPRVPRRNTTHAKSAVHPHRPAPVRVTPHSSWRSNSTSHFASVRKTRVDRTQEQWASGRAETDGTVHTAGSMVLVAGCVLCCCGGAAVVIVTLAQRRQKRLEEEWEESEYLANYYGASSIEEGQEEYFPDDWEEQQDDGRGLDYPQSQEEWT
jgi:hypothetical protein